MKPLHRELIDLLRTEQDDNICQEKLTALKEKHNIKFYNPRIYDNIIKLGDEIMGDKTKSF